MATETLRVRYRPLRVGMVVRHGNFDDLNKAVELNTALWGGIYNPIFAIKTGEANHHSIGKWRPDLLHPVVDDPMLDSFSKEFPWLKERFTLQSIIREDDGTELALLDVLPVFQDAWEHSFRFETAPVRCLKPIWNQTDPLANFFAVQFGSYPKQLKTQYESLYRKYLKAVDTPLTNQPIPEDLSKKITPIVVTGVNLERELMSASGHPGVYMGDPKSFDDLINFWNIRANGSRAIFWPIGHSDVFAGHLRLAVAELAETVKNTWKNWNYLNVWYRESEIDVAPIKELVTGVTITRTQYGGITSSTDDGQNTLGLHHFPETTLSVNIDHYPDGKPHITLVLPKKPFIEDEKNAFHQHMVVGIHGAGDMSLEGYTLRPPCFPQMNEWLGREYGIGGDLTRVQPTGVDFIKKVSGETLYVYPLASKSVIKKVFHMFGIKAESNHNSKIADRIIAQMGGIERCRVFKIQGVRKLIENKDANLGIEKGTAVQVIRDEVNGGAGFDSYLDLRIEKREKADLNASDVFNFLLKKKIFRSGISVKCPNCELEYWASIESLRDELTCEYCVHKFALGPQLNTRGDFKFRLSGLFQHSAYEKNETIGDSNDSEVANEQRINKRPDPKQGAIPVILALQSFLHFDRHGSFLFTTSMDLECEAIKCETDLAIVERSERGNPAIIFGECKTRGEIDDKDVTNMTAIYREIKKKTGTPYILFAKTADFLPAELERFKALVKEGIRFLLLTPRELEILFLSEAYHDDKEVPHQLPLSLQHLADNSVARYLK